MQDNLPFHRRAGRLVFLASLAISITTGLGGRRAARALADWPTYRGDPGRTGYTADPLPPKLSLCWTYQAGHAPCPAWSGRDTRMPFDNAYHVVTAGDLVFFGSSADNKIYALDAATGQQRWSFFTDSPVRFPPTAWKDRVLAVSDDGFLYCLAAKDGQLLWKIRGGPDDSLVLGNDRITSRWPARGAPVIADGVVYFGAGIWPSEGIFVYAVNAQTGKVLWCNDSAGGIYMGQPHGGANAKSGVSAQGHFLIAGDKLLVPTGRAVPAAFQRADGKFLYFHLQENTKYGGSDVALVEDIFLTGKAAFDIPTGARNPSVSGLRPNLMAALPDGLVRWHDGKVHAARLAWAESRDRKGNVAQSRQLEPIWSCPTAYGGTSLITAGPTAVSAGPGAEGYGVSTVDLGSKQSVWSGQVDGVPWGLSAAAGRLFVSTDAGTIYCYDGQPHRRPAAARATADAQPFRDFEFYEKAAEEIVRGSGVTEGYCLDLGCGDGALACALARRSNLHIYAVDSDPRNVAQARQKLDALGLYGVRVTVHQGDPARTEYPDYFANLIVSGGSLRGEPTAPLDQQIARVLRPYGGVACIGGPGNMTKTVRGPLDGAGWWTHQYCDPANTNCSTDSLVRGPLGVLWFTDLGFPMPSRHGRGRSPLLLDGRLFIQGRDGVLSVDAYNGRNLWQVDLPGVQVVYDGEHLMGASGTGSNFCVTRDGLYVHTGQKCLKIDPADGRLLAELKAPDRPDGRPGRWGLVACVGETLFGTLADTGHVVTYRFGQGDMSTQFTESLLLFAMDANTGRLKWQYQPQHSIRHNTVAIGNGRVHLIDRPMATGDRHREAKRGVPDPGDDHLPGTLVALDAQDGNVLWKSDDNIYGTVLALSEPYQTLVMCYQDWRFKLASERGGRMAAFDATDGARRWDIEAQYVTRPIINDRTIYIQPGAWDLLTGDPTGFSFQRSYGCGIPAGSKHMMVFRSATLGYVDLLGGNGTQDYGGIRPGCWINALPAGGLVLMPDATDRCTCSYLIKSSIALKPSRP